MSVEAAPISDVADVNPELSTMPAADEELAFVGMADLDPATAVARNAEVRPYREVFKAYTPFEDGDVLLAKITPCFENMKIGQARTSTRLAFGSTEFHVIRAVEARLDRRYLLHFLRQRWVLELGALRMTGSAGQRRVPERFLDELEIPLPPIEEQRRIAVVLDAVEDLRARRRLSLVKLEALTQAIFIDMFGDPLSNPRGFAFRPLGFMAVKFSDGPFGSNLKSDHYVGEGVRVVRLQNIGVGEFRDADAAFISESHFEALRKHECRPGDVLVGTLGDPNLRACIQPDWLPLALNKADCVQIRVDPSVATNEWMSALLNCPATEVKAQSLVKGQTRSRISMGRLRGLEVPVPSLQKQQEFASHVAKVRHASIRATASQWRMDRLFASVEQRAFRGEL